MDIKDNTNSITVGVPFYGKSNPKYLNIAIKSIINQSLPPEKIHLIQDGSVNQKIKNILDKYVKKYPKLIDLIVLAKKGLPYALNESIKRTTTKYYARMDSDDISIRDRFEIQSNFLEKKSHIDILGSWAYEFENDFMKEKKYINQTPNKMKEIKDFFHYRNPLIHPSVMFRVSLFQKIGFYNEKMYTDQDLELWGRALKHRIQISNIEKPLIFLRIENRLIRRSRLSAIKRQILIRYSYNTSSFKLNVLKLAAIILRILPLKIQEWSYRNLRDF